MKGLKSENSEKTKRTFKRVLRLTNVGRLISEHESWFSRTLAGVEFGFLFENYENTSQVNYVYLVPTIFLKSAVSH